MHAIPVLHDSHFCELSKKAAYGLLHMLWFSSLAINWCCTFLQLETKGTDANSFTHNFILFLTWLHGFSRLHSPDIWFHELLLHELPLKIRIVWRMSVCLSVCLCLTLWGLNLAGFGKLDWSGLQISFSSGFDSHGTRLKPIIWLKTITRVLSQTRTPSPGPGPLINN